MSSTPVSPKTTGDPAGSPASGASARPPRRPWAAVGVVAAATFAVVTTEMLPVGLLTSLGAGLGVSAGTAGLAVTLPGLLAAAGAVLLPVAVGRADRRTVLCALLLLLAAANVLCALAPGFGVLLAARALVGVCIGGVWAVAAGLAVRLVPAASVGRATALIFSGIAVASVLGVPAGTYLGALAGWRWAFAALSLLAAAVAGALRVALPPLAGERPVRPGTFGGLLRVPRFSRGLTAVALLVTGHFAAYTYVRPLLERAPGTGPGVISALLLGYGLAGIAGTFALGALAGRDPRRALLVVSAGTGTAMALLAPSGASLAASAVLLVVWGLLYGGVSVSAQTWLSAAAPGSPEAASGLFAGVFNAAIALGAFTGGRIADGLGLPRVAALGAGLALLALAVVATAGRAPGAATGVR